MRRCWLEPTSLKFDVESALLIECCLHGPIPSITGFGVGAGWVLYRHMHCQHGEARPCPAFGAQQTIPPNDLISGY